MSGKTNDSGTTAVAVYLETSYANEATLGKVAYSVAWRRRIADGRTSDEIVTAGLTFAEAVVEMNNQLRAGAVKCEIRAER